MYRSVALLLWAYQVCGARTEADASLKACGNARYLESLYTCYENDFLCPIVSGQATLKCGDDCYLPSLYSCVDNQLQPHIQHATVSGNASIQPLTCNENPTTLHLSDPPYENYFYSDCHSATQVVVTSPLPDSNLTIIGPRVLVAWPAGNSGLVAFFAPQNGRNGTLGISLLNSTYDSPLTRLASLPGPNSLTGNSDFGISTLINFNSSAELTVPIIGSIRNIRDFTEGPSILEPLIQDALRFETNADGAVSISRLWLDNKTSSHMSFTAHSKGSSVSLSNGTVLLGPGTYNFTAWFDYPQLQQLGSIQVLNDRSRDLVAQEPDQTASLSFLSYTDKLLAGAWRFLTYFGRDSMISYLLMEPILSQGNGSATEAVLSAVLERINRTDGSVCHEETIGDYSTFLNRQMGIASTAPGCTYLMVDTDFYLVIALEKYLQSDVGRARISSLLNTTAAQDFGNRGWQYSDLLLVNAEKVMLSAAPFAQDGGQSKENLIHLKQGQVVGQWRDSTYGIGGGRIPYDVNTALVPAALRSIASLAAAGVFPSHLDWQDTASQYARIWEDATLQFFSVTIEQPEAQRLVEEYTQTTNLGFPSLTSTLTGPISYHGLALDGNNNQSIVKVMNTDDCFRHFLLNTTDAAQLTAFLNQTANNILNPYPLGLLTSVGLLVANPAYGGDPIYAQNFTYNAYHGTVVWSWQIAMMAAGLERQLDRCISSDKPQFCADSGVHNNVRTAYNRLWDVIEDNQSVLSNEVWSWVYKNGEFVFEPLGALPPQDGASPTESNVRQLWSLTFLAVKRNEGLRV